MNSCPYTVTTCAQSANDPIYQYNLGAGAKQYLDFGSACKWPQGAIWASVKGQCAVSGIPNAANDRNLADLAEFTIGSSTGDYYDISNVVSNTTWGPSLYRSVLVPNSFVKYAFFSHIDLELKKCLFFNFTSSC